MALVLAVRPHGLLGRPVAQARGVGERPVAPQTLRLRWLLLGGLLLAATPLFADRYTVVLLTDIVLFALFAASLQFLRGPGGMTSFGHAAFLGIGAYAAALLLKASVPMPLALVLAVPVGALFALVIGWFCVRLSGVYLAMLTLAFAQIIWSITFQWDAVTGGSNGLIGLWPAPFLADKTRYFWLALACAVGGIALLWRLAGSPFGLALRAGRDAPMRATASGVDVPRQQWLAFAVVGAVAALAGSLYAFSKGSISPDVMGIPRSVDALVAVLLGGVHAMVGPILGSALFVWAQDELVRGTDYWRALLGALILVIVLVLPGGLASLFRRTT
jgi:branched-chain amino acid transport system permease protein